MKRFIQTTSLIYSSDCVPGQHVASEGPRWHGCRRKWHLTCWSKETAVQTVTTIEQSEKWLGRIHSKWQTTVDLWNRTQTKRNFIWNDHPQCFCYIKVFITSCLSTIYYEKIPEWFNLFVGILLTFNSGAGETTLDYKTILDYSVSNAYSQIYTRWIIELIFLCPLYIYF